jgi:hypothetical protein
VTKFVLDFGDTRAYRSEFALGWRSSGVEQLICNQPVGGSNPFASSDFMLFPPACYRPTRTAWCNLQIHWRLGEVPERPKGADCKSAGVRLRRFESSPPHWRHRAYRVEPVAKEPDVVSRRYGQPVRAGIAQLVERQPSKLRVAGSNPVSRSNPRCSSHWLT